MELEQFWPPGGYDPDIDALAGRYISDDRKLDLRGLLADPLCGRIALVSSFGTESAVLLCLCLEANPDIPIFFIDTEKHFAETYSYIESLRLRLGFRNFSVLKPNPDLISEEDPRGDLHSRAPDTCCMLRKTFPLQDALAEYGGWITGRKRYHGGLRQNIPFIERDGGHLKINPLIYFTPKDIMSFYRDRDLPTHPLVAQGYASVGCAPCTAPVSTSGDVRAGRWPGLDKTECGIHLGPDGRFARISKP